MPNQALEQTRDNVLRYGEVVGCELLNFSVRSQRTEDSAVERRLAGQRSAGAPVALNRCGSPFGNVECRQQETANDACRIAACSTWPPEV
jgi:hypothetical protein